MKLFIFRGGPGRPRGLRARASAAAAASAVGVAGGLFAVTAGSAKAREQKTRRRMRLRRGGRQSSKDDIAKIFESMDADGSGEIDAEELRAAVSQLGLPSGDDYLSEVLTSADPDSSGTISKAEFTQYVRDKEKAMLEVFNKMDVDGSGKITSEEIQSAMAQMGIQASAADGARMVELLDQNSDGTITFDEFKKYTALLPAAQLKSNAAYCWMGSSCDRVITNPREPLKQLLVGGVAGAASRFITAPLQRVRVVLMASQAGQAPLAVVKEVFKAEGLAGFWRGSTPRILKVMPGSAIQFATFASVKNFFLRRSKTGEVTVPQTLIAGGVAGMAACLVVYPFTSLAGQMSVAGGVQGSIVQVSKQIYQRFGIGGFYKGLQGELLGDMWGFMLGFGLYDLANDLFFRAAGRKPKSLEKGLVGGTTACVSVTTSMPLLLATTRMQVQGLPGYPVLYKNVLDCLVKTAKQEGAAGLWKGILPSYAQIFPCIFISYFVYEALSKELGLGGLSKYDKKTKK
uniref:EF-hand domain-containing protein n=1 Tax=Chloropicon laureae TaxID=464258 RepID=A0A7S2YX55_9CHLO|mmetsp:Transcript_11781/g.30494  ORF Transcript_11781/g.30494 Transcript_11781/m.30494 type:complete len:515 (+) Transcript_11781:313-1857(+)